MLLLLIVILLTGCKNYYEEPCEMEFKTVFDKIHFFNSIPDILRDENFVINKSDEERGFLIAEKFVKIEQDSFQINISIRFDAEKKVYYLTPSSAKLPRNEKSIRYYTKKKMPKNIEPYFKSAIERIEAFNKGKNFPNN